MICPKCGLQTLPEQKFCRSCGASLQVITQRLPEGTTLTGPSTPAIIIREEMRGANRLVQLGFIVMFVGAVIGVIGKMLIHDQVVTVVGVLFSLVGMFLAVYPYLLPSSRTRDNSGASSQPELQKQSRPTKQLPEERTIEYVPSITERTTDLLKTSGATPKQKEEENSHA
jgi:zinc-ribbon domain